MSYEGMGQACCWCTDHACQCREKTSYTRNVGKLFLKSKEIKKSRWSDTKSVSRPTYYIFLRINVGRLRWVFANKLTLIAWLKQNIFKYPFYTINFTFYCYILLKYYLYFPYCLNRDSYHRFTKFATYLFYHVFLPPSSLFTSTRRDDRLYKVIKWLYIQYAYDKQASIM